MNGTKRTLMRRHQKSIITRKPEKFPKSFSSSVRSVNLSEAEQERIINLSDYRVTDQNLRRDMGYRYYR